jgi:hypothetical protein
MHEKFSSMTTQWKPWNQKQFFQCTALLSQKTTEISDIVTKQNHIIGIVQEHEVALHTLKHVVFKIRDGFISLANIVDENSSKTKIH